jgi:hypothetical protein
MLETVACAAALLALLAMMTPTLSEYRRQSKEARCISNLQRIADAGAAYAASDPNELLIPAHPSLQLDSGAGSHEWGGKAGRGEPLAGGGSGNTSFSKWGTQLGRGPGTRPLNAMLYKGGFVDYSNNPGPENTNWLNDAKLNMDVYRCPGDYGYTGIHATVWRDSGLTSFDHYGNSYTINTVWIAAAGDGCQLRTNTSFMRPASTIPSPARTLSYVENAGKFAWRANFGDDDGCGSVSGTPGGTVRGWHGSPWNFITAFVDGHVRRTYMQGRLTPQPNIGRFPDFDSYEQWRCVIIRGIDWQMDTLPASPFLTDIPCSSGGVGGDIE